MDKQTNTQYHIVSGKHANIIKYINDALKKYVFTDTLHTKVVKNIHGDSSGVRGAAWLS